MEQRHTSQVLQKNSNKLQFWFVSSCLCVLLSGKTQSILGDVVQNSQLWATVGFMMYDDQLEVCNTQPDNVPALLDFSNHAAVLR